MSSSNMVGVPQKTLAVWPFTSPFIDLLLMLAALPLLWVLGFEQILPIPILLWAAIKLLLTRHTLKIPPLGALFLLFVIFQIVSATSIDLATNWIVFAKNFASYLVGFLLFLIVVNQVKTPKAFRQVSWVVVFTIALITLIGTLFILGFLPGKFQALGANLVPGFLRGSEFVQQNIILREIGRPQARLGSFAYRRVSSIFLYPTTAAVGYLIFIPFLANMWYQARGGKKWFVALLFLFAAVNFLFTATRTAVIALIVAAVTMLLWQKRRLFPPLLLPALAALLAIFILAALLWNLDTLVEATQSVFINTRADSFTGRTAVYVATFNSLTAHPLIGWGTPRAIPTVKLAPAGTHGEYINILYSFGLVGLTLYLGLYALIWLRLAKQITIKSTSSFALCSATTILALNINGIAHGINFDLLTVIFFWLIVALLHTPTMIQDTWNQQK